VVSDYGKNGITVNEEGTAATILGNKVTGVGPTDRVAQNGIQLGWGASGQAWRNRVSGNWYRGEKRAASGILLLYTHGVSLAVVTGGFFFLTMMGEPLFEVAPYWGEGRRGIEGLLQMRTS